MYSSKDEMFIGLLLRAMKNDVNVKRVSTFSKRLLQVALQQPPQYACVCLFLLSEVLKSKRNGPHLWNMMIQNESLDDDIEHFEDVVEESENEPITKENEPNDVESASADSDSSEDEGVPRKSDSESDVSEEVDELLISGGLEDTKIVKSMPDHLIKQQSEASTPNKSTLPGGYDPRHREPSYWYMYDECVREGVEDTYGFIEPAYACSLVNLGIQCGKFDVGYWADIGKACLAAMRLQQGRKCFFFPLLIGLLRLYMRGGAIHWIILPSYLQEHDWECGYYCMNWMYEIVSGQIRNNWVSNFAKTRRALTIDEINYFRDECAIYFGNRTLGEREY